MIQGQRGLRANDQAKPDVAAITEALNEYEATDEGARPACGRGEKMNSFFISGAKSYLTSAKQLMRRIRDKKPLSQGDRMMINAGGGEMIEGTPQRLLRDYDQLIEAYNRNLRRLERMFRRRPARLGRGWMPVRQQPGVRMSENAPRSSRIPSASRSASTATQVDVETGVPDGPVRLDQLLPALRAIDDRLIDASVAPQGGRREQRLLPQGLLGLLPAPCRCRWRRREAFALARPSTPCPRAAARRRDFARPPFAAAVEAAARGAGLHAHLTCSTIRT